MSDKKIKNDNVAQAIKFALFSASAGIIQFVSFTALTEIPKAVAGKELNYWACYLPALILSVLWNFTFNRKFTFKSANNVPVAMAKVAAYYAVFTPVSTILGDQAEASGVNEYVVLIVTMLANFVTEFLFDKFVVFRGSENTNDIAKKENSGNVKTPVKNVKKSKKSKKNVERVHRKHNNSKKIGKKNRRKNRK